DLWGCWRHAPFLSMRQLMCVPILESLRGRAMLFTEGLVSVALGLDLLDGQGTRTQNQNCAARCVRIRAPTRRAARSFGPLASKIPPVPIIRKPAQVLLVDCVLGDASLVLHRFCDSEALCSIGCNLGADLGSLVGPARLPRGLKDYRTNGHG